MAKLGLSRVQNVTVITLRNEN
ncbi:MAG: hypothetical protein RIQ30_830, partial [Pseudomonadota bacterium]